MKNSIEINGVDLQVKIWNGQRVVTFADIDRVHEKAEGTAKRTFHKYKQYFTENHDYFIVKPEDFRKYATCTSGISETDINNRGTTFITESGYLKITKPISGEKAWQVQCMLVNSYFKFREVVENLQLTETGLQLSEGKFADTMDTLKACAAVFQSMIDYSTINYKQQQDLLQTARNRVNFLLGGAHSPEYKEHSRIYFKNLWQDFCKAFECGSYKDLNPSHMADDTAKKWIQKWEYIEL